MSANKKLESKIVYSIYSAYESYRESNYIGEFRSEPNRTVEISHHFSQPETKSGEIRSEPNSKVEISLHFDKNKVYSGDSWVITDLFPSANSAELGRVKVNDLEEHILMHKCKTRLV